MNFTIKRATKEQSRLRLALIGPSGSGKTYSALAIAVSLGKRVCLIDTERGSASKYADLFAFDVLALDTFAPDTYVAAIECVTREGYDVIVIDSLSHAWMGKEGALEQVDKSAKRSNSGNSFAAWRDVTPMHNRLVDALVSAPLHVVATIRSKTEWVMEEVRGKMTPRKIGMAPIQRDGLEYEFDVVGDMNLDNELVVTKTRCPAMSQKVFAKPGADVALLLNAWLTTGAPATARPVLAVVPPPATRPASVPPPAMHDGGAASALWSAFSAELSQAPTVEALRAIGVRVAAAAKAQKLTLEQTAKLRDLAATTKAAILAPRPVAEVLAGNPLPESWGGAPAEATGSGPFPSASA